MGGISLQSVERSVAQTPLVGQILARLADAERVVIRAIKAHLAEIDPPDPEPADTSADQLPASPTDVMRDLLDRSMYTRPDDSRTALYLSLLSDLLPDEARILAALSDGSAYPVIDIAEPLLGTSTALVLTNASTVGRAAGVTLPHHTPLYVTRMVLTGLAVIGPEGGNSMYDDYEMLLTDASVNMAIAKARRGIRSARVIRRTVRISELGQELWEAAK
ncbi:Abi-alpha family protein [Mycolicibacterium sp. Dal123E01]|uniref:Abi-alpha family protein n=1 Tax=Mycolicibacterium sp. Dal123E01 TaxID=3457578 RepID=UPI00403E7B4A